MALIFTDLIAIGKQSRVNITKLTEEIIEGKGYVVLPDLLSPAEVQEARDLILKLASQERNHLKLIIKRRKERLHGLIYKGDIFSKLVGEKLIIKLVEEILGKDMILAGFSAHILHSNAKRMGVHVDYPYWAMPSPYPLHPILEIQVIWMIDDFTANNGATLFAAGTQKLATKPDYKKFEQIAQKITGKAGTAIVSHGLCWHDTSENKSDRLRTSVLGSYTPQYIHPLENNSHDFDRQTFDNFTPRLKKLLRHTSISNRSAFDMKYL